MTRKKILFQLTAILIIFTCFFMMKNLNRVKDESNVSQVELLGNIGLTDDVLKHRESVERYAKEFGIEEHIPILLALIEVETHGLHADLMRSSESLGLPVNTLTFDGSIEQGCKYFSELLEISKEKQCNLNTTIQAYNFGSGFIEYVSTQGNSYSYKLAEEYAKKNSEGVRVEFLENYAVAMNGGWRYQYGNQFYVLAINKYLINVTI